MMGVKDARKPEQPAGGKAHNQPSLCVDEQDDDDEPSMTQEEYERRLAEEDQSKPSQVGKNEQFANYRIARYG